MSLLNRLPVPRLIQLLASCAAIAGIVVWWLMLSGSAAVAPAASVESGPLVAESPAAQWFANLPVQIDIKVTGLLATARGAVAILAINDAPARPFLAGELLAQGVKLVAVEATDIVIERDGVQSRQPISRLLTTLAFPTLTRQ